MDLQLEHSHKAEFIDMSGPPWLVVESMDCHLIVPYDRPATPYCPSYHLPGAYRVGKADQKVEKLIRYLFWILTSCGVPDEAHCQIWLLEGYLGLLVVKSAAHIT